MNVLIIRYLARRMDISPFETCMAADAMIRQAIGGRPVESFEFPLEDMDMFACQEAYDEAPRKLRRRMDQTMIEYRAYLEGRKMRELAKPKHVLRGLDAP